MQLLQLPQRCRCCPASARAKLLSVLQAPSLLHLSAASVLVFPHSSLGSLRTSVLGRVNIEQQCVEGVWKPAQRKRSKASNHPGNRLFHLDVSSSSHTGGQVESGRQKQTGRGSRFCVLFFRPDLIHSVVGGDARTGTKALPPRLQATGPHLFICLFLINFEVLLPVCWFQQSTPW